MANFSINSKLAVPNSFLRSDDLLSYHPPSTLDDVIHYHVLLQYLSSASPPLAAISPVGKLTTLFQTTGRAINSFGSVNITRDPVTNSVAVCSPAAYSSSNATIITLIENLSYNLSIFSIKCEFPVFELTIPFRLISTEREMKMEIEKDVDESIERDFDSSLKN